MRILTAPLVLIAIGAIVLLPCTRGRICAAILLLIHVCDRLTPS